MVVGRVSMRANNDGVALDADFDVGIRLDVDLPEN
jgi:hypothetical protein